jgi:hypothetical protein
MVDEKDLHDNVKDLFGATKGHEEFQETMSAQIEGILEAMIGSGRMFEIIAKAYWMMYQALVGQGFTEEQAMDILKNYNPVNK